jgi:ribosomal protein S18 acetylase RimI-like enzyme
MSAEITIRPGTQAEWALAIDSFVESFRDAPVAEGCTRSTRAALFCVYLNEWRYLVAVEPEANEVLGFIVASRSRGHVAWLQVKAPYRRRGVATALLDAAEVAKGQVKTPFLPGGGMCSLAREHGYRLCHRPWMAP